MAEVPSFDPAELTKETCLWDIWVQARRLPESRFNVFATEAVCLLLVTYVCFTPEPTDALAGRVRDWSDFGMNFAGSLLGFLIAGFTIFATLIRPGLFLSMAKVRNKKTGQSHLKTHFFRFMKTFSMIFFLILVSTIVKLLAAHGGAMSVLISHLGLSTISQEEVKRSLSKIGVVFIGTIFFYLVVLLQSFIFNIYIAIMTSLRWELESESSLK